MKKTKVVKIGNLEVGGKNPIRIKGMLKTPTSKIDLLVKEAKLLAQEGTEAIRLAVEKEEDAKIVKILKKQISIPIAADIHFKPQLAIAAINNGFDQIRLNPLNISDKKDIKRIAQLAGEKNISIRVGVNSGGFRKASISEADLAKQMVEKTINYIQLLESQKFFDIMVSLKCADITATVTANKIFSKQSSYPLHLGITATGSYLEGITKSSVGLGIMLQKGLGDIIRVSLTTDSVTEIKVAKYITQSLNLRKFGPEIISCPTCSRCRVNLPEIVDSFRKKLDEIKYRKPCKIAIMGCVVNGPGEAAQADLGVAFGKGEGVLFRNGKTFKKTSEDKIIDDLIKELKEYE
ncbi:MAG: flavodoxin-dependent (E)-4-hydroxy-3-methylbut-2-enyl-diphosphate synthase [Candidatus Omnitrophica bacterium]|nr:flavodoxin-dependent (E)-4-hydroxy-3-methylbut-2-enyl-diphosphate synthase [Candidatus Omnitrophota bacterium]MCF7894174.1 flavodoxin-dependent (E)-4-hydroxy-3-methylbut-2-enyl-diphosphate synthase [Candidatus Omnitrophota bacterium]